MNDTTTPPEAPKPVKAARVAEHRESHLWGLSLRGLIALLLVVTLCALVLQQLKVEEPFSGIVSFVLGWYFRGAQSHTAPKP